MGFFTKDVSLEDRGLDHVTPGTRSKGTLIIDAEEPFKAGVLVEVRRRSFKELEGNNQFGFDETITLLDEPRDIPAGKTEIDLSLKLPPAWPPSYESPRMRHEYVLRARLAIAWAFDTTYERPLRVSPRMPPPPPARSPQVIGKPVSGRGIERIELAIDASVVPQGRAVRGHLALTDVDRDRARTVTISLLSIEGNPFDEDLIENGQVIAQIDQVIDEASFVDDVAAFEVEVPDRGWPSFSTDELRISWHVRATMTQERLPRVEASLPIVVVEQGTPVDRSETRPGRPDGLGATAQSRLWAEVASKLGMSADAGVLRASFGDESTVELRRVRPDEGPLKLVGAVRYTSLSLGLRVEPEGTIDQLMSRGIRMHDQPLVPGYVTLARDAEQALVATAPLLGLFDLLAPLHMNDDELVAERYDDGSSAERLTYFARLLLDAARTIVEQRRRIPPPSPMATALASWRKLAADLQGDLDTATMLVKGTFDDHETTVRTDWSGDNVPLATVIVVRSHAPLDPALALRWKQGEPPPTGERGALEKALAPLLDGALAFELSTAGLELRLPAPALEAAALAGPIERLSALLDLIERRASPYR